MEKYENTLQNIDVASFYQTDYTDYFKRARFNVKTLPNISNVIFNDPATIVFWSDGTKTVVKCGERDIFDPEKGLAMAVAKKALGNKGNYYNEIKKWLPEGKEIVESDLSKILRERGEKLRNACASVNINYKSKEKENDLSDLWKRRSSRG